MRPHRPARSKDRRLPCASTAMCLASFAKGTPRARPDKAAVGIDRDAVLRACRGNRHRAVGRGDLRLRQQPSRQHGFGQRHRDRETPGGAQHAKTFGETRARTAAILGTHDSGRPASVSACHSGAFQAPFLSRLMVCASARSANIFSAVSATIFSLSATAFPVHRHMTCAAMAPGLRCGLFLRA